MDSIRERRLRRLSSTPTTPEVVLFSRGRLQEPNQGLPIIGGTTGSIAVEDPFISRPFRLDPRPSEGPPDERIEPMDRQQQTKHPVDRHIMPSLMAEFMQ